MDFDELQSAWQAQDHRTHVTLDTEVLLKEVRRNQRQLEASLLRRDFVEIVVSAFLTCFFLYGGVRKGDWTLYLLAFGCFGVGTFLLVDRLIQRRRRPTTDDPLLACIQASLMQVNHQIWLLKNILWWYLLPIAIGLAAGIGSAAWKDRNSGSFVLIGIAIYAIVCVLLFWGIYWLNQKAVERHLDPRRKELESLLDSLKQ